jgi:hypothetical protein
MKTITPEEAKRVSKANGLLVICAMCPRWYEGQSQGLPKCTGKDCGSPITRKDFPEYDGDPLNFSGFCFVCGSEDVLAYVKVEGSERQFGVCKSHLEIVDDYGKPSNGIFGEKKSVLIFPNTDKAMGKFREAKHIV